MKKFFSHILFFAVTWYWRIFRPKEFGVKAIVKKGDKILCIRQGWGRSNYTFPGGRIDKAETPDNAIAREVKEEVGIDFNISNYFYVGSLVSMAFKKYDTIMVYTIEVPENTFITIDNFEVISAEWFSENSMPKLGPIAQEIFKVYKQYKSK